MLRNGAITELQDNSVQADGLGALSAEHNRITDYFTIAFEIEAI